MGEAQPGNGVAATATTSRRGLNSRVRPGVTVLVLFSHTNHRIFGPTSGGGHAFAKLGPVCRNDLLYLRGDQFEHDPENLDAPIRCAGCDRIYTREQLIAENGAMIESALDDMKADVMDHARKTFRDAFRGSKYIKVG